VIVRATYRLQFHKDFTFADATVLVPYLDRLGISHVYASPVSTARPGSMHGYDVIDHTRINPELGGKAGLRSLVAALRARGMGLIIDIVPNHMGIAGSGNRWWQDVLANGQASAYAGFFDIDWRRKLLLPLLGEPLGAALESGAIKVEAEGDEGAVIVAHDQHRLPLRPEDQRTVRERLAHFDASSRAGREAIRALLERQHYRLAWWRSANDELNWRRFFTITELAGVRVEDEAVFKAVHELYFRLYAEGVIDGVRVDHVDGLTDPAGYCRKLRERLAALVPKRPEGLRDDPPYIVVEKILGAGERLASNWGVDGTTGYDFMDEVSAVLHDPAGEMTLGAAWAALSGRPADFEPEELEAREQMLRWEFEGQLRGCVEAFAALAESAIETRHFTAAMLRRAVQCLLWVFPVYRTYGTGSGAPASDAEVRDAARRRSLTLAAPGEMAVIDAVLDWLAGTGPGEPDLAADAVRRFQQLSAPIAAKAVEDTAFYRYGRLLSRNDVGFDLARFSLPFADFHGKMRERAELFPRTMLATATHDHKRGEDVRARLALLSEIPDEWITRVGRWQEMLGPAIAGVAPDDLYQLFQMLVGAFPDDAADLRGFSERIAQWQQKAVREAKLRSSWTQPDAEYERRLHDLVDRMLDPGGAFQVDLGDFVARILPAAHANGLAATVLHYTAPGVPDLYQGTEFEDLSLVDPDNRRPVDFVARQTTLDAAVPRGYSARKQALIARLLSLRRALPDLFSEGSYEPVAVTGAKAGHVLAFARRQQGRAVLVAVALRCASAIPEGSATPGAEWWADTMLDWNSEFQTEIIAGARSDDPSAAGLFAEGTIHVSLHGASV
jgi:(1->4)-alpha-D-glucan 1-alpha-D-glucosylmutase